MSADLRIQHSILEQQQLGDYFPNQLSPGAGCTALRVQLLTVSIGKTWPWVEKSGPQALTILDSPG